MNMLQYARQMSPPVDTSNPLSPIEEEALSRLEDIVLPPAIGIWPLSPALWAIISVLGIAIIIAIFITLSIRKKNAYRKIALSRLNTLKTDRHISVEIKYLRVNQLLKQCCVTAQPTAKDYIANLWGNEFYLFLEHSVPPKKRAHIAKHSDIYNEWQACAYQNSPATEDQLNRFFEFTRRWIQTHHRLHIESATDNTKRGKAVTSSSKETEHGVPA